MQFILLLLHPIVAKAELLEWGRLRISPEVSIVEKYNSNIFLSASYEQSDYITVILPTIPIDIALTDQAVLSFQYKSEFVFYEEYDVFKKEIHIGEILWLYTMSAGSTFKFGAKAKDASFQPYSITDRPKNYIINNFYSELNLKSWTISEIKFRYDYRSRKFDKDEYETDNYDRNSLSFQLLNHFFYQLPLLFELRYYTQNNEDPPEMAATDMNAYEIYAGGRWEPEMKLSGVLRVGWNKTDFEELKDYDGVVMDTDLLYRITDITELNISVKRDLNRYTSVARETGNYYVTTAIDCSAISHLGEQTVLSLFYKFRNDDYKGAYREDDKYQTGLRIDYAIYRLLAFNLGYQYRHNKSTLSQYDYEEHVAEIGLTCAI